MTKIEEEQTRELIVTASSPFTIAYAFAKLLNEFIGTKLKMIIEYRGVTQMSLAMERGEVDAHADTDTWSSWKASNREWFEQEIITVLAQINPKVPDLPGVPAVEDMVVGQTSERL